MSIYRSLIERGYLPKELPPAFFSGLFAKYAATRNGRKIVLKYVPVDRFTECVKYRLALPGLERRELKIPHPASFAKLASLTAKNLGRLLKIAGRSDFSRSRPVYDSAQARPIHPMTGHTNLSKERAVIRGGSSFLLKTDISQFYPSLYTHAVGWAVDPKLRNKSNWGNTKLLGKRLDQALMDLDGKFSQGIPIGNDISFLLAEVVLAQVDKSMKQSRERAFRWFDDYEMAFDTASQAEAALRKLNRELGNFRLRLNPKKTTIVKLPRPAQDEWQEVLKQTAAVRFTNPRDMVKYFDAAFRLREQYPEAAVLSYAMGILFKLKSPNPDVARIAQSCITQTLLSEPGAAQKVFALLAYWHMCGVTLDVLQITNTINQLILRHHSTGFSSDIAWALAFSLDQRLSLNAKAGHVLSFFDDDCIALQALHMHKSGLIPKGFNINQISKMLRNADLDREHWLIAYESFRHGFLPVCGKAIRSNPLFSDLLSNGVTFYRTNLPTYASILHPGGAPQWLVRLWSAPAKGQSSGTSATTDEAIGESPIADIVRAVIGTINHSKGPSEDSMANITDLFLSTGDISIDDIYPG